MKIDRAEVEHVALLARLKLSDSEMEKLTNQLNSILSYMDKLNELDTEGLEPMAHAQPIHNAFREDEVRPSLDPDSSLSNAPERNESFFLVPRII
ncbi:MAG: Asp-tRNA(Asn)/Glu-tRNA(Gln) amidotransferase subunit GatC [Deltaproteobacteria bacterium]|nr:Asp-tRNA(Asn)/Glu-tRNA(Gln) amidotransferase subunit GatC [Deltaproteobacteria bacterium]MBW2052040.1 Asp-tRNA(Asn)/Glu-tRNA(Gln) amidotransferase subunit GatC [Deltaproteobacteria bacterium]MBW2141505.1 Asp-tRNA(Asn)/Glu-tRNA(Gln) amidotransferase subunit GatC [Deltaproteobacteria bacterium]